IQSSNAQKNMREGYGDRGRMAMKHAQENNMREKIDKKAKHRMGGNKNSSITNEQQYTSVQNNEKSKTKKATRVVCKQIE
ncbi:unnamed protein product, partial [Dovyalis caffra]